MDLEFNNVCAWVGDETGRQLLFGLSGRAHPGELTMLMGASGAGKSTLMAVLSGRASGDGLATSGAVLAGGKPYDGSAHARMGAFVTQDTSFHSDLTPREILQMRATLALAGLDAAGRAQRVEDALEDMQLALVSDTRVGELGVHGGLTFAQRKRLAVAGALLVRPRILFVDEPTTGLDGRGAQRMVSALATVAQDHGIVVLCTVHQPSVRVLEAFDSVMLMAAGRFAYRGPMDGLVDHFAGVGVPVPPHVNPADHILDVLDPRGDADAVKAICKQAPGVPKRAASPRSAPHREDSGRGRAGLLTRLFALVRRSVRMTLRNEQAVQANVVQNVGLGLLLGFMFSMPTDQAGAANRSGFMFLSSVNVLFLSVQGATLLTIIERAVVLGEIADGLYGPIEYIFAKVINEIPFQALYVLLYCGIEYPLAGLRSGFGPFMLFFLVHLVVGLVGTGVGLAISTRTSDIVVANAMAPLVLTPAMMFSGYLVANSTVPFWARWIRFTSPLRYALIALVENEAADMVFSCTADEALPDGSCPIPDGRALIASVDGPSSDNGPSVGDYIGIISVFYVAAILFSLVSLYLALARRTK